MLRIQSSLGTVNVHMDLKYALKLTATLYIFSVPHRGNSRKLSK